MSENNHDFISLENLERFLENLNALHLQREKRLMEIYQEIMDFNSQAVQDHPDIELETDRTFELSPQPGQSFMVVRNVSREQNGHSIRVDSVNIRLPHSYIHPNSGINPGSFRSVIVDAQGHVIGGFNPATLNEYGITDVPTFTEMRQEIAQALADSPFITRLIVQELPDVGDADPRIIYMVLSDNPSHKNIYIEYMIIDGAWEVIGDTEMNLEGFLREDDLIEVTAAQIDELLQ